MDTSPWWRSTHSWCAAMAIVPQYVRACARARVCVPALKSRTGQATDEAEGGTSHSCRRRVGQVRQRGHHQTRGHHLGSGLDFVGTCTDITAVRMMALCSLMRSTKCATITRRTSEVLMRRTKAYKYVMGARRVETWLNSGLLFLCSAICCRSSKAAWLRQSTATSTHRTYCSLLVSVGCAHAYGVGLFTSLAQLALFTLSKCAICYLSCKVCMLE
jgi:hypothetical protein